MHQPRRHVLQMHTTNYTRFIQKKRRFTEKKMLRSMSHNPFESATTDNDGDEDDDENFPEKVQVEFKIIDRKCQYIVHVAQMWTSVWKATVSTVSTFATTILARFIAHATKDFNSLTQPPVKVGCASKSVASGSCPDRLSANSVRFQSAKLNFEEGRGRKGSNEK